MVAAPDQPSAPAPDWGLGSYEPSAATLQPASDHVIALAAITPGERLLDVGCGTGNGALAAARAGARVTGVDPAARLLEVARGRAAAAGLTADFTAGTAGALPFGDETFDVVISVFGVIFAPDPPQAVAEIVRVLRPGGRALVTAWVPDGAIHRSVGIAVRAVQAATGVERPSFPWHDPAALGDLVARNGARLDMDEAQIAFTAASLDEYVRDVQDVHPMVVASRPVLERAGTAEETRRQSIAVLRESNEDPSAFRVTSRYRIARITRLPGGGAQLSAAATAA